MIGLHKIETASRDEISSVQRERLSWSLHHAYRNVPHYRLAFDAAGDPDRYPELGEPWQPLKLYYSAWSVKRMMAMHERMLELGLESPMDEERLKWFKESLEAPDRITTSVDISDHADVRQQALLAHRTQVDPNNRMWFGLPDDENRRIHPYDDYVLARSLVTSTLPEDDLFAGVRASVRR